MMTMNLANVTTCNVIDYEVSNSAGYNIVANCPVVRMNTSTLKSVP